MVIKGLFITLISEMFIHEMISHVYSLYMFIHETVCQPSCRADVQLKQSTWLESRKCFHPPAIASISVSF